MISNEFLIISIVIFLLVSIIFYTFRNKDGNNQGINMFTVIIPLMTNLFLIASVYVTYQSFQASYQSSVNNQTMSILSRKTELIKIIKENVNDCPLFIQTLKYPFEESIVSVPVSVPDSEIAVRYISSYIFQTVVMYLTMASTTVESDSAWLGFFGRLFYSKKLVDEYNKTKHTISVKARLLIETLISINSKKEFKNPKEVIDFFDEYVKTKEFTGILEKIDDTNVSQKLKTLKENKN